MALYKEKNLDNEPGDIFTGITAAVIALPIVFTFGITSGAGAEVVFFRRSAAW